MTLSLENYAKEKGVKFFLINFTDLFGSQRAKLVPASAIAGMQKSGAGFAGFATWLDMTPGDPDMFSLPDAASVIQLPWKPEVAWVAGDPMMNGVLVEQAPRVVLKRLIERAAQKGWVMKSGVEPEFHLINSDGTDISDARDTAQKPCYDQSAIMRRFDVIAEICTTMLDLGWSPYQNDHEDANGQFEINWNFNDSLTTADQHAFFKFMVKEIAEKHGLRATFMPKPFSHLTGNGCHVHTSVWDAGTGKKNLFHDKDGELGISEFGYHFLGGVMQHAESLVAITNPTVNSYKRINAPTTSSGATWAPNAITYGGNNRTHLVRIPDEGRFEVRVADGAANPYLLQASVLAAGLDGVENKTDPGKRLDINMYTEGHTVKSVKKLPLCLIDAIRLFANNTAMRDAFGREFCDAYIKLKTNDWNQYGQQLTQWERNTTLDC